MGILDEIRSQQFHANPQILAEAYNSKSTGPFSAGQVTCDSAIAAMQKAVNSLAETAPDDNDVLIFARGIEVATASNFDAQVLSMEGVDDSGKRAFVIVHFSQLVVHVFHRPKKSDERVITGFN
jgi:mevalonate pyrophosphate decarboxylase